MGTNNISSTTHTFCVSSHLARIDCARFRVLTFSSGPTRDSSRGDFWIRWSNLARIFALVSSPTPRGVTPFETTGFCFTFLDIFSFYSPVLGWHIWIQVSRAVYTAAASGKVLWRSKRRKKKQRWRQRVRVLKHEGSSHWRTFLFYHSE